MSLKVDAGPWRLALAQSAPIRFVVDGEPLCARQGESVMTALATTVGHVRRADFSQERRAGFCMMGACQDCWLWRANGERLRACTSRVEDGMQLMTRSPGEPAR